MKWEYKLVCVNLCSDEILNGETSVEKIINAYCNDGWELVSVIAGNREWGINMREFHLRREL